MCTRHGSRSTLISSSCQRHKGLVVGRRVKINEDFRTPCLRGDQSHLEMTGVSLRPEWTRPPKLCDVCSGHTVQQGKGNTQLHLPRSCATLTLPVPRVAINRTATPVSWTRRSYWSYPTLTIPWDYGSASPPKGSVRVYAKAPCS